MENVRAAAHFFLSPSSGSASAVYTSKNLSTPVASDLGRTLLPQTSTRPSGLKDVFAVSWKQRGIGMNHHSGKEENSIIIIIIIIAG